MLLTYLSISRCRTRPLCFGRDLNVTAKLDLSVLYFRSLSIRSDQASRGKLPDERDWFCVLIPALVAVGRGIVSLLWRRFPPVTAWGQGSLSRYGLQEIPCKWEIYREKFKFQATRNRPTQRNCRYSLGFLPEPGVLK